MQGNERVYAAINLDHISENIDSISNHISKETKILAVIKTDGYGHGAVMIAREAEGKDCVYGFGVATVEEAMELREAGIHKPILVLGYCFSSAYETMIENDISATVFDTETALLLQSAAKKLQKIAKIHLKVDTGMSRIGFMPDENGLQIVKEINELENIQIEGIFTHFARADEADKTGVNAQIVRFMEFLKQIEGCGIVIPLKHCSNSASIIELPDMNMNLVRAGIILYGLWPSEEVRKDVVSLKPVMELKSTVVHVKEVPKGTQISYGGTYITDTAKRIATVAIGYGDGYPRCLSNIGYVLVRGKKAPIVGRVCMDQMMIDVTDIPDVKRLDTVTLVGRDGDEMISMEEFSLLSQRINYESVCDVGKRVPRIYFKNGEIVSV